MKHEVAKKNIKKFKFKTRKMRDKRTQILFCKQIDE